MTAPIGSTKTRVVSRSAEGTEENGGASDAPRPNRTLFIRNLPEEFDQTRCDEEFAKIPGFKSFRVLVRGKQSGFATYESVEAATAAKEAYAKSILKVTFKGSTVCDMCGTVCTAWINSPCKSKTLCGPRCFIQFYKEGHGVMTVEPPVECQCLEGRKFKGAIRCCCQKVSWCRMSCMEKDLEAHLKVCIPRRFIPLAARRRFFQNGPRDFGRVKKLNTDVREMKQELRELRTEKKGTEAEMKRLRNEIRDLKLGKSGASSPSEDQKPSEPYTLPDSLQVKGGQLTSDYWKTGPDASTADA